MKERLIELLMSGEIEADKQGFCNCYVSRDKAECIADFLLESGVIVPPCKIGDRVWILVNEFNEGQLTLGVMRRTIDGIAGNSLNPIVMVSKVPWELRFHPTEFGKNVFLTEEEAIKKIAERNNE